MDKYQVYIRVDDQNRITAINSSAFLTDTTDWLQIDEGWSDQFHHAQGNYLPKSTIDDRGVYRYMFVDDQVVERTQEEMDADWEEPESKPSDAERIAELEEALELLLSGVTE